MIYDVTLSDGSKHAIDESDLPGLDKIEGEDWLHLLSQNSSHMVQSVEVDLQCKKVRFRFDGQKVEALIDDQIDQLIAQLGLMEDRGEVARDLVAPMPGLVLDVLVSQGSSVEKDDPVIVLQAMKMENLIKVPAALTIAQVHVEKGQTVDKNELLISFAQ